ncbi:PTS sugar transporter subunit IIB [Cutibacterium sp. WCA-380-WT-3A]|uniref:PTS sugar transporter subunit IIB n=1 Tax=Cutibacterium porci TaxID=2605781 RepID=A0A7K0J542_9ACTN|nr:PTS sugar transporter subunit IIB [Cutibacterium porci]MSS45056.1 PTS sugar transporter subunit IIB [Cutibacterium porci]
MINKKVLVCCGTGIATSVQVANKLNKMLRERGINASTKECKAMEVPAIAASFHPDAIVSTTMVRSPADGIKVFKGVAFLTGVGADKLADEIANYLKD